MVSKKTIHKVSFWPINVYFAEYVEVHSKQFLDSSFYFHRARVLLIKKVTAGKCQNFQPFWPPTLIQLYKSFVVVFSKGSFTGHIHHNHQFFLLPEFGELYQFAINVVSLQLKEILDNRAIDFVLLFTEKDRLK